jgi:hypothetical protein
MVIIKFGLAAKYRHRWAELDAHCPSVDTALAGLAEYRTEDTRSDDRRIGKDRPQEVWRRRDLDFLTDRNH